MRTTDHQLDHESIESELLAGSGWALPQAAAMFRKSAVEQVGGYRNDYPQSEDLDVFLRLAEIGRLANLRDALAKYRVHPNSTNWKHSQTQLANKPALLAEAYRRRGRPMPADLAFKDYWIQAPNERFAHWV
jgi:GT2 family glycosyltransferase